MRYGAVSYYRLGASAPRTEARRPYPTALGWLLNLGFAGGTFVEPLSGGSPTHLRRAPSSLDTVIRRVPSASDTRLRRGPSETDTHLRR